MGVNLVIDNFLYVAFDTLPLYSILKQSDIFAFKRFEGYKSVVDECSLGVNLVSDNFCYVASFLCGCIIKIPEL